MKKFKVAALTPVYQALSDPVVFYYGERAGLGWAGQDT